MSYLRLTTVRRSNHKSKSMVFDYPPLVVTFSPNLLDSPVPEKTLKSTMEIIKEKVNDREEPGVYPIEIERASWELDSDQEIDYSDEFVSNCNSLRMLSRKDGDDEYDSASSLCRHYRDDDDLGDFCASTDFESSLNRNGSVVIEDYVTMRLRQNEDENENETESELEEQGKAQINEPIHRQIDGQNDKQKSDTVSDIKNQNIFSNGFRIMKEESNDSRTEQIEHTFKIPAGRLAVCSDEEYESVSDEEEEEEFDYQSESRSERMQRRHQWMSPPTIESEMDRISKLMSETFLLLTDADFETDEERESMCYPFLTPKDCCCWK